MASKREQQDAEQGQDHSDSVHIQPTPAPTTQATSGLLTYASFETRLEDVREALQRDGVCVIPNVLSGEELEQMRDGMWETLAHLTQHFDTPVTRDASTWHAFQELRPLRNVMLHDFGIGQAQVAWDVRQNPRVAEVFARIWRVPVERLLTSTDGMSVHFPDELIPDDAIHPTATAAAERTRPSRPRVSRAGTAADDTYGGAASAASSVMDTNTVGFYGGPASDWFHVDQAPGRSGMQCVQGLVSAWDVTEGDGSLAVLRGSHRHLAEFARTFQVGGERSSFFTIRDGPHRDFFDSRGCERVNIKCPAGSLVLWDSRTVHCGCLPQRGRPDPKIRFVVYVCMGPRPLDEREETKVLDRKQQIHAQQGTTSHMPLGEKMFPLHLTHTRSGRPIPPLPTPSLTSLGRLLAGLDQSPRAS